VVGGGERALQLVLVDGAAAVAGGGAWLVYPPA